MQVAMSSTGNTRAHTAPTPMRLSSHDAGLLRHLWCELPSEMGLGSNFGSMIHRLIDEGPRETPKVLHKGCSCALCKVPEQTIYLSSPGNGAKVGHVCRCETDCNCPVNLFAIEGRAKLMGESRDSGREERAAWLALTEMRSSGHERQVDVLYRMYGGETPQWLYSRMAVFEDLVPLVPDTELVGRWVTAMSAERTLASGKRSNARVTEWEAVIEHVCRKSGDTKARDQQRGTFVLEVKRQATHILVAASNVFLAAKRLVIANQEREMRR